MSAPKRIWVTPSFIQYQELDKKVEPDEVEYLRADIVRGVIEAEPEYPGDLPDELRASLETIMKTGDMDALVFTIRTTVKLTKESIKQALAAMDQH